MKRYSLGIDYGTNSCRSLLIDLDNGAEVGSTVFNYPSGEMGILLDEKNPHVARQNPQDYLDGLEAVTRGALQQAREKVPGFDAAQVVGIGIDTTGSTPIPVNKEGTPLGLLPEFKNNLNAMVWLWKDHTGYAEAAEITKLAHEMRPNIIAKCGGIYSSEWWWSKILRLRRADPAVFAAAYSFVEHCDWIPAVLTGNTDPLTLKRGVCSAGHKAMYSAEWGGLPDKEFLAKLDPALADLRDRLYEVAHTADVKAGDLCAEWAQRLGLKAGIAVSVGAFDAHMGAVGAGIKEGTLVKILGTSTCDLMIAPTSKPLADVPGVCGIVNGSVLPGYYGIEAGQSAVGDIFLWFVNHLVPDSYGASVGEKFVNMEKAMAGQKPGATGLLALDWNNGNRTILVDVRLTGLLLGQTLHTEAHEIYRAYIEATAFGALTIIKRVEEYGVKVEEVINTGGLSIKNATLMQCYADIIGKPMKVSQSEQTCALGAAIFGAAAAGAGEVGALQAKVTATREKVYYPIPENQAVYAELYALYRTLHDAFGTAEWSGKINHVMKDLLDIRARQS
ncbi:ribulokinase [Prosthecobacter vanneervenii]|uniref:Ribulokinase n=1 Tax=Prosthecobacter vanneervenii TaxID=48466 RepID=A0A7W7YG04_9BACT|nr:ribulokinase [Prosthecobacter vanneervenii]MBB5035424.1 L-ribulokinase [Prosthecobacter vanneervenii]